MRNIYQQITSNIGEIHNLVLATVAGTEGSTPQKPGSSALFNRGRLIAGTVGGGVLEGKVQMMAKEATDSITPGIHLFRLDNTVSGGEDALCGGKIRILIDPALMKNIDAFRALTKSSEAGIPGVLITLLTNVRDNESLISRFWVTEDDRDLIPGELRSFIEPEFRNLLSGTDFYDFREMKLPDMEAEHNRILFLEPVLPPPKLIIAGAGHIGKALSQICGMLGFELTIIDDRTEFANPGNIPLADHIIVDNIGKAIDNIEKRGNTYIVIVTRGHKDDRDALKACIGSGVAYIGMIGSKNKIALMHKEFIENNWATESQWNGIFAPVGIDINSRSVEEIAVSIAAQLVKIKNERVRR